MAENQTIDREAVTLHTLLANYPCSAALRAGTVSSPLVRFDFADVKVSNTAFKPLVREQKFDVGELAMVTFLQAKTYGKPYVLLPAVVVGRDQHHTILYNPERGTLDPRDLSGRRIGVRAYTQTTGTWVRGMLQDDYGMDVKKVRWITFEDPHLAEYRDPEWVERAPAGKELLQMLLDGELDAAIFGSKMPEGNLLPLIPEPKVAARKWAESHGGIPVNHMVVVKESIAKSRPDIVREVYRLLRASRDASPAGTNLEALRFGIEQNRQSLETIVDYAVRQELIPRPFTVDELFDDLTRSLE